MRLFKRNGIYYIEFSRGDKKSLKTRNRGLAKEIFDEAYKEHILGRKVNLDRTTTCLSIKDLRREYLISREGHKAANTTRIDGEAFDKLEAFLSPDLPVADITRKQCDDFVAWLLGVKELKPAFNKAVEWEYIERSPRVRGHARVAGLPRISRPLVRDLEEHQIKGSDDPPGR